VAIARIASVSRRRCTAIISTAADTTIMPIVIATVITRPADIVITVATAVTRITNMADIITTPTKVVADMTNITGILTTATITRLAATMVITTMRRTMTTDIATTAIMHPAVTMDTIMHRMVITGIRAIMAEVRTIITTRMGRAVTLITLRTMSEASAIRGGEAFLSCLNWEESSCCGERSHLPF
jgi:hypothetical protein